MNVLLMGATGFTGSAVLPKLLAAGHQVTVLVRSSSKINIKHEHLRIIEGDVLDPSLIENAVTNQDAVINCIGKNKGSANNLISSLTRDVIHAMEEQQVPRLIALSNVGAGDSYSQQPWLFRRILLPTVLKWLHLLIEDKNVMEPMIKRSSLEWTVLRFPKISNKPALRRTLISEDGGGLSFSISLEDCANFIVNQLQDRSLLYKTPSISN